MNWNPFTWFYDAFELDPVARSIHQEKVFEGWMGIISTVVFFVALFIGWVIIEVCKDAARERKRATWERHCADCKRKHNISYVDRGGTEKEMMMWCEYWYNGTQYPLECKYKKV
jgi:hypothetical protein